MSLPLEDEIMKKIGLGMHYNWYNGRRSCGGRRSDAISRLYNVILEAHKSGEEISPPNLAVIQQCRNADALDRQIGGEATLTKTWQALSNAIRWHMEEYYRQQKGEENDS